jgi:hypothetical protein
MPEGVADQGEDKQLGDALDGKLLVSVANREEPPMDPGKPPAEGAGRRRREGRNVVRDGPLVEMEIALVAGGDEGLHVSIGREHPRRYSFDPRMVAGQRIAVHFRPFGWRVLAGRPPPDDRVQPDRWYPPAHSHVPQRYGHRRAPGRSMGHGAILWVLLWAGTCGACRSLWRGWSQGRRTSCVGRPRRHRTSSRTSPNAGDIRKDLGSQVIIALGPKWQPKRCRLNPRAAGPPLSH